MAKNFYQLYQRDRDATLLDREAVVEKACALVAQQVPQTDLRTFGLRKVEDAIDTMTPFVSALVQLPGEGPQEGTDAWVRMLVTDQFRADYCHMARHPQRILPR